MKGTGSLKKILILTDWYEPGYKAGGPIQSCRNFVEAMHGDMDISILTSDRDLGETRPYQGIQSNKWIQRQPGILVYYADIHKLNTKILSGLIHDKNPDFIYLNSMYSFRFSVLPMLLRWRNIISAQLVLAPRGMLQEGALQFKTTKKKLFIGVLNFTGVPKKIIFHATDKQEKEDILKYFPKARGVEEIANFSAPVEKLPGTINKTPGKLGMVYISRIIPKKNIVFFLKILSRLNRVVELNFDIFGSVEDQTYWEQAKKIISSLPDNISVREHGALPHEKVAGILEASHIFVLPSKGENFGHAILEAFSAGRPVLISNKTPWLGLHEKKIGWDLPLEDEQSWLNAINEAAGWDQTEFDRWSRQSREFAENQVNQPELKKAYKKLFT